MKEAGNHVISIVGARNKELVILEQEIGAISDELLITTDDGTYGRKGFVTDQLKALIESGRQIDLGSGHRTAADDAGRRRDDAAARDQDGREPEFD